MTEPNVRLTKRSVKKTKAIPCQGWDKGTGKCGAVAPYSKTYGLPEVGISHTWHFCKRHYDKRQRKEFGTCSYRERREDGTLDNCTALRKTNTRGKSRKNKGYCRRHEGEFLASAGDSGQTSALDRLAEAITPRADTGCWITPPVKGGTRGRIKCGGKQWTTYRFTFVIFYGGHANGQELSHDCDESLCCNPMHVTPIKPRMNRDAEHDITAAVFWAVTSTFKRPPPELEAWADSHGLPLYGTETTRIADKYLPSEDELLAQYWADLEAEDSDAMALAV